MSSSKTNLLYKRLYLLPFGLLLLILVLRFSVLFISSKFYGRDLPVHGHNFDRFHNVRKEFKNNFIEGLERDGSSFAVYHKGKLVVNLWSGTANTKLNQPWNEDTRTLLFSTTKALSSLCIALLVDRGELQWNDRVVKYWPEYGVHGKENTTIQHVLSHQAGLPYIEEKILYSDALDIDSALAKIANSKPLWTPGTKSGYHALTFGWLIDGIIKHVDKKGRHLSQFFKEEIAEPHNLDISIGLDNEADFQRSGTLSSPLAFEFIRDTIIDPRMLFMIGAYYFQPSNSIISLASKNPHWLGVDQNIPFNDYKIQKLKMGATNGLSNAHNLAKLFNLFINSSIVSPKLVEQMSKPVLNSWHHEQTVIYPIMKGYGLFYEAHPTRSGNKFIFGHPGLGCQGLHVDTEEDLVVVYLSNGLKSATSILCRPYQRLLQSVYDSI